MACQGMQAYENVKNQIGYCGIWCGSCVVGNGTLRLLTKKYEELTKAYDLEAWAPRDFDYSEFSRGLTSIQQLPTCPGCLKGGGRDDCEIRNCAREKELRDCTRCEKRGSCQHEEIVEKMRSGAKAAGLDVNDPGTDGQKLIQDWAQQLERRWPCNILFLERT